MTTIASTTPPRRAISLVLAVALGALFGAGLLVSGMTAPAKVIGFLDLTGAWDPSLLFVMGGAVIVNAAAYWLIRPRRARPWLDDAFHLPGRRDLDAALIAGAAIFGVGWGLGGLCPGPGLVSAASGDATGLAFVGAMVVGMLVQHRARRAGA